MKDFFYAFAILMFLGAHSCSRDDSDSREHASSLEVRTDCRTGGQYLESWTGSLTPRLDADGKQIRINCR